MVATVVALIMLAVAIAVAIWIARASPDVPRWKYRVITLSGVGVFSLLQFKSAVGRLGFPASVLASAAIGFGIAWVVAAIMGVPLAWWEKQPHPEAYERVMCDLCNGTGFELLDGEPRIRHGEAVHCGRCHGHGSLIVKKNPG